MKIGTLRKLKAEYNHLSDPSLKNMVEYFLPIGSENIPLNNLIGQELDFHYTGNIYCIDTGKKIKKSYGQGHSWEAYVTLPECDQCIFQPELCHYAKGTCRDSKWGEEHCFKPHVIYLSLTSDLKVGITRRTQIPTRWIDQGAARAIILCEVKDRLTSGLIEVEIAKDLGDKTNWRNMLKNKYEERDLLAIKADVLNRYALLFEKYSVTFVPDHVYEFIYPVEVYPEKVSAINIYKNPHIKAKLLGVKGQYLIFDKGVINIRKYQGHEVQLDY